MKRVFNRFFRLPILIVSIIVLLGLSIPFFFLSRQRAENIVYISGFLLRPQNIALNIPIYSIPYWIGASIDIGHKELNPFGVENVVVVDKEIIDSFSYGQIVSLLLKIRASKDRSDAFLYKNKPIAVGSIVDLKLTKSHAQIYLTYIGNSPPEYDYYRIKLIFSAREMEPAIAEAIKSGMTISDDKKRILGRVLDRNIIDAQVRADSASGQSYITSDRRKRDARFTLELLVKKIGENYYFSETQKVKVNETLFLPFPQVSNLNLWITEITSIDKVTQPSL